MNFLAITIYAWMGLLVLKVVGFPMVKEITWGQLFLIPVVVFLMRFALVIGSVLLIILGLFMLMWFTGWAVDTFPLMNGYP